MAKADAINIPEQNIVKNLAAFVEIAPLTVGRIFVRGFLASMRLSTIRLNPMAAALAAVNATSIIAIWNASTVHPFAQARHSPARAKGRANRVWPIFIMSA